MSVEAISLIMRTHIPDGVAKLVAMVLADYADPVTGRCWPKIPTLAKQCSQSERTVQRKLKVLEDLGVLHVEPNTTGDRKGNMYVLHLPGAPCTAPAGRQRRTGDTRGEGDGFPPTGDTQSPVQGTGRVTVGHPTGDTPDTRRVTLQSPPIENPPLDSTSRASPQPPGGGKRVPQDLVFGEDQRPLGIRDRRHRAASRRGSRVELSGETGKRFRELIAVYPVDGVTGSRQLDAQDAFGALCEGEQRAAIAAARLVADKHRRRPGHVLGLLTFLRQTDFAGGATSARGATATPVELAAARNAAGLEKALRGEWPIGCSHLVRADSPAGAAWEQHFARFGTRPRWIGLSEGLGAYLPAAMPPAIERVA